MKKIIFFLLILFIAFIAYKIFSFSQNPQPANLAFASSEKLVNINDNGLHFEISSSADTIENVLREKNIEISENDQIIPDGDAFVFPGSNLEIRRAVKMIIEADGRTTEIYTTQKNLLAAITESGIKLNPLDKLEPDKNALPQNNLKVIITRINVEEKTVEESIDFKITEKKDPKLGWREEKVEQPGEKGIREVVYRITYKNGKEVTRVALSKNITRDPVSKIIIKGTYVKLGKAHTGLGTWYAWKGGLFAASPWLPMGSYARVTNKANGKSVIVQINDRGPFGDNRIIDLDKVAFQKIASLGAGVIDTKVEEVLN